jgi:hypothetical protein
MRQPASWMLFLHLLHRHGQGKAVDLLVRRCLCFRSRKKDLFLVSRFSIAVLQGELFAYVLKLRS